MTFLWYICDITCYNTEPLEEDYIMKQELLKGLTEEQIAKVKAWKNSEELLKAAKEEDIELNDEQLEVVNGGCGTTTREQNEIDLVQCPECFYMYCMEKVSDVWYRCKYCKKYN